MHYFNSSPQFVPLPMSPGVPPPGYGMQGGYGPPGQGLAPGYHPFPWGWPSPHMSPNMYPVDLQPQAVNNRAASIHVLLAPAHMVQQPHVLYDVRYKSDKCYMTSNPQAVKLPDEFADSPATNPPVNKLRLVSRDIPWRITASNAKGVTVRDILDAIHNELHTPLTEGEWWIAQEEERDRALAAYQDNCSDEVPEGMKRKLEEGVKRVDWLGKKTMLMSISRTPADESFIKARIPDKKAQTETWVVELGEA